MEVISIENRRDEEPPIFTLSKSPFIEHTEQNGTNKKCTISFSNLNFFKKPKNKIFYSKSKPTHLLKNISGRFKEGLNAIIGPAGSGKTLLMEVLAGLKNKESVEGTVLVNDKPPPPDFYQQIGYVTQEDMLMESLTVRENMRFSADLRLQGSEDEKEASVHNVLSLLQLNKCAHNKIGNEWIRGVSGGERRRTNIGMEMLKQPQILFLDEPTSGLDAHTALSIIQLLKRLSSEGRTIIFTIHQPRYSIFKLFDSLTILNGGTLVFHGASKDALNYFNSIGHECDDQDNPADFFLDVLTANSNLRFDIELASVRSLYQRVEDLNPSDNITILAHESPIDVGRVNASENNNNDPKRSDKHAYPTSFLQQVKHLTKRSVISFIRNPMPYLTPVIINQCFAILIGLTFYKVFTKVTSLQIALQNRTGALYFVVANQMYNCFADAQIISTNFNLFRHETKNRYYRISAYFISKLISDLLPLKIVSVFCFSLITYFMFDIPFEAAGLAFFFYGLLMMSLVSGSLSLLVTSCFKNLRIAHLITNFFFVFSVLFSGYFVNNNYLQEWLSWLKTFSLLKYSFNTILISQLKELPMRLTNGKHEYLDTHSATERLHMLGVKHEESLDVWSNLLALHLYSCFLLAATYLRLRFVPKHK